MDKDPCSDNPITYVGSGEAIKHWKEKMLSPSGKPFTAEHLFLAMCVLLMVSSAAANASYRAYIAYHDEILLLFC